MPQNGVADAVSLAVTNLYDYRENAYEQGWTTDDLDYKICLQVHDALMALVRYDHVPYFIDTVLPACMIDGVPVYPCHLDGMPMGTGPFKLGIDTGVYFHWGVTPLPSDLEVAGINPKYAHWQESTALVGGKSISGLINPESYPKQLWYNGALHKIDTKVK